MKEYDELIYPVDIGIWTSYRSVCNEEQLNLQENHLLNTGLSNGNVHNVTFIFTKYMKQLHEYIVNCLEKSPATYVKDTREKEAFYSARIEGAEGSLEEAINICSGKETEVSYKSSRMIENCYQVADFSNAEQIKMTPALLVEKWEMIVDGVCDNQSVRGTMFRNGDIRVGAHIPPYYTNVPSLMIALCDFINSDQYDEFPFIKAGLIHYVFESIHPFCDGNGRTGRWLIYWYLASRGIKAYQVGSFSELIDKTRSIYYMKLTEAINEYNDCTAIIEYLLSVFADVYTSS